MAIFHYIILLMRKFKDEKTFHQIIQETCENTESINHQNKNVRLQRILLANIKV